MKACSCAAIDDAHLAIMNNANGTHYAAHDELNFVNSKRGCPEELQAFIEY